MVVEKGTERSAISMPAAPSSTPGREPISTAFPKVYLQPGEYLVSAEKKIVSTVLGSCVSVCLFDRQLRMGAINHFLLPYPTRSDPTRWRETHQDGRFAVTSIPLLLDALYFAGSRADRLAASVFGGAIHMNLPPDHPLAIGARNVDAAFNLLREAGVQVTDHETGGQKARKLRFQPWTGRTRVEWV